MALALFIDSGGLGGWLALPCDSGRPGDSASNSPLERPQLNPLAAGRRPGGSSGTSIVEPSSSR